MVCLCEYIPPGKPFQNGYIKSASTEPIYRKYAMPIPLKIWRGYVSLIAKRLARKNVKTKQHIGLSFHAPGFIAPKQKNDAGSFYTSPIGG
jgi:hypothetical protein